MKKYTADFETATWLENETYVWAWATCEIGNEENLKIGNNIDDFIEFCKNEKNAIFYFHNLAFDGEFIIYWLLTHNFKHITNKDDRDTGTFETLISDLGQFYQITVYFYYKNKNVKKVTFIDSLKIIPFSVEVIAKSFNLSMSKLTIDYNKEREKGHILTEEERNYIRNDVTIVAKALDILFNENLTRMTQGSNALYDYKKIVGENKFEHWFPQLDYNVDKDIRQAYHGGFTYLNPIYKEKEVQNITVLDVNSLYPSVMRLCKLPFGEGLYFDGEYVQDKVYNLYIKMFSCSFEIKKNKIPCVQIKNNRDFFRENEWLTSSNNNYVTMCMTNVDFELFKEHYNIYDYVPGGGWKFRSLEGMFNNYIDKWIKVKIESTENGNLGMRTLAKLMLNSLYGKFATSLDTQSKIPVIGEDEAVHYILGKEERKKGLYIPLGCFVTAYAREKTIRTAQAITDYSINKYGYDAFVYSDTDSIHTLLGIDELKQFCEIDSVKLGAWKNEGFAKRAKFIRQKCYVEEIDNKMEITCAGMPKSCYSYVDWENFKTGLSVHGKLVPKHVKGGIILREQPFTLKEEKLFKTIDKRKKNN